MGMFEPINLMPTGGPLARHGSKSHNLSPR